MFKNIFGTMSTLFRVGGPTKSGIQTEAYGLSIRDSTGATLKNLGIARARASQDSDAGTYLDIKEKAVLIEFSFNGSSAPTPGANSGKYGMCHTSGGLYNAGAIYYDTGATLSGITIYKGQLVLSTAAFSGTVSLLANGLYVAQSASAPYSWTLKGDGAATSTGLEQSIQIPITTASSASSTTSISANSEIREVLLNITSAYSGGTSIIVSINGSSPLIVLDSTENDATVADQYSKDQDTLVQAANAGVVSVSIGGAPAVGAGKVIVKYISAFLG